MQRPIHSSGHLGGYAVPKSIDGGASCSPRSVGLPGAETANTGFLQVDPHRPDVLYLGTEGSLPASVRSDVTGLDTGRGSWSPASHAPCAHRRSVPMRNFRGVVTRHYDTLTERVVLAGRADSGLWP
jgi:hypothetical protein